MKEDFRCTTRCHWQTIMHRMQRKIMANEASVFDLNSLTRTMSAVPEAGTDNHAPISANLAIITVTPVRK
jgi:hypothetical protein